jgi:hypothetical protein
VLHMTLACSRRELLTANGRRINSEFCSSFASQSLTRRVTLPIYMSSAAKRHRAAMKISSTYGGTLQDDLTCMTRKHQRALCIEC